MKSSADEAAETEVENLLPFLIVGIGASAGGIQAYIDLFSNLPSDTGMAFVIVTHLAPDQKSRLRDILALHTAMPVSDLDKPALPEPNHVYVLPPNQFVTIVHGVLTLEPRPPELRIPLPINHFFRSLASDQKNHAIGVVLSGMDSDGALGLRAIKGEGGISIVQEPSTARFPSMPENSIATDHVDIIVPPERIGKELARLAQEFARPELLSLERGEPDKREQSSLSRIFASLHKVSGIDFAQYKPGTITRRIGRRMMLGKMPELRDYASYLEEHPNETGRLQEDLLIHVTRFFRDPEVFEGLTRDLIPHLFTFRPAGEPLRIWVAGCSTGEEVYSIAICLLEFVDQHPTAAARAIQIFGTDASESSIKVARAGIYTETMLADISPARLQKFFVKLDNAYQISKRIRDLCTFARHNLCTDPPFSQLDFVSCRNVLIYLKSNRQEQILRTFHYSLRAEGYLLLGKTETTRQLPELFSPLDRKNRLFKKIPGGERSGFTVWKHVTTPSIPSTHAPHRGEYPRAWSESELQQAVDRVILTQFDIPVIAVNEQREIVLTRGRIAPFLEIATGTPSLHFRRMLRSDIAEPVAQALTRAIEDEVATQARIVWAGESGPLETTVDVVPLFSARITPRCYAIVFHPIGSEHPQRPDVVEEKTAGAAQETESTAQLRKDLAASRRYLQSVIEERDHKSQELISTSEELLSQNEELQSTNEELETTKEEIQSANEELHTVNDELQQRNAALVDLGNDLTNLLASVNLPVLMLNTEMQIRQFTPAAQKLISVRSSDIGRPIKEIRLQLSIDDVEPILTEVLETLSPKEMEVQDKEGRWYLLRVRPYRTSENKIEGTVLLLFDIDESRRAQIALREARDFSRAITESLRVPVAILHQDFKVRTVNAAFRNLLGTSVDVEGRSFPDLARAEWDMKDVGPFLERVRAGEAGTEFTLEHQEARAKGVSLTIRGISLQADREKVLLLVVEDVTFRKEVESLLTGERNALRSKVLSGENELARTQDELRALTAKLFTSQEEERRRLARELHDDLTQKLGLIDMRLEQFALEVPDEEVQRRLQAVRKLTASVTEDARKISHRLHPAIVEDLGLGIALKALTEEFAEREAMPADFEADEFAEEIPPDVAGSLYRIAQEALRNVAKHAGKTHVKVSLRKTATGIRMEILDFGRGFSMEEQGRGLGLISMVERARLVGGGVAIESTPGRGTAVRVDVPGESEAASA